jgi:hypothetical protein
MMLTLLEEYRRRKNVVKKTTLNKNHKRYMTDDYITDNVK